MPSDFVAPDVAFDTAARVLERLSLAGVKQFGVRVHHAGDYPAKLRDARHPVELLYYQGEWVFVEMPGLAIVGILPTRDMPQARPIA